MHYEITVRGRKGEWAVPVPERMVEGLREDGFEVDEVHNSMPVWALDMGLASIWIAVQDTWDLPSRFWRWLRKRGA